jgi:RNA polymerase sigma-70 factor (ECF subfamily)
VRAWEALPAYEFARGSSLAPWLYRIAHNLVMDHYRRQHLQEKNEPLFAVPDGHPSVEETVARKENLARLVRAVRALGEVEQSVLLLRFVEQLPYREVAQIVDKSEGACRVIQYRALAALRDLLEAEAGTQEKADG